MSIDIKESLLTIYNSLLDPIFPKKCYSCGELTDYGEALCRKCSESLLYINLEKRCKFCGKEKKYCVCKRFVYRFNEVVSVFEYDTAAKSVMLNYKVGCRSHYADFISKNMAKYIIEAYGDIAFDCICCVPSTISSELRRGFVPTEVITRKLSKYLMLPFRNVLFVKEAREKQTNVKRAEKRIENAIGKYGCNANLNGKTVLLIDDVITTGATLNDCTRALLFMGAESVYCATALASIYKNEKT